MEYECPPAKKRNISQENKMDHSESNRDQSLEEISDTKVVVKPECAFNDGNGSLMDCTQIDHLDIGQENNECKNMIVMEESKLDATEACADQIRNDDNSCGDNGCSQVRKKLLVLDVNGLLVDIVADPDEAYRPDTILGSKAVFKRPFCDEFLKFCFERFNVGVWTSRTRRNIEGVLKFLAIDPQHQLLFCWDQFHCTHTGFNTIENSEKPLVLKELKKLWEKQDPKLPWDKGVYNESNTIFLDDSPYKALRNPPYTAIFPYSYSYRNTQDNGLGPNGDLRNYLERLAASDNVQKFIKQNPFGQQPITCDDESWYFYRKIIGSHQLKAGPSRSRRKLIVIDTAGLLVDLSTAPHEGFRADTMHGSTAVFKRPYCDDFLQFCLKRFNVGVWTSTSRHNTECALDFLMGDTQRKLLFCWDRSHCTDTGFCTVENNSRQLILKELRKLWEKKDSNLPWEIGDYDESNTLLVENAPYKALLNPPHTAIFPYPYRYWNKDDNSLGPKGDLRVYLERLAASENVQKFVSENPFGQRPIRDKNLSWGFYQKVIHACSSKSKDRANGTMDAQGKNSSDQKTVTATALATPTLLEPKANSTTALAAPTLLEPKAITSLSAAPTLLEPEAISTTVVTAPVLLEPKADSTSVSVASTLSEPKADSISTVETAPTLLEPKADSTSVSVASTFSEPKADSICTVVTAPTLVQPKADSTSVTVASTLSEPNADSISVSAASTILEPETDAATSDVQTSMEPQTNTSTASAAQISLEPQTGTTVLAAETSLEPQTDTTTVSAAQTSLEPQTDTATVLAAPN